jgi:APA family basic amino acid/polyamine antiporter
VSGRYLTRRLGLGDAVVVGLGAMVGTGVFTVAAPAAAAAGRWLLLGLVLAAVVATCNAVSSADLAAAHPESGGSYVYGRERLGPWWGFLAGAAFVVGKSASCAAAALVFASYVAPGALRPVAVLAVIATAGLNVAGVRWTATTLRVLVAAVLLVLAAAVVAVLAGRHAAPGGPAAAGGGVYGVLRSGGLVFFAFAGYARIATLGEEVRDPARTIRRAVPIALAVAVAVYAAVLSACLVALGAGRLAGSGAPVADAVRAAGAAWLVPVIRVGAAVATLSVLLSVLVGISRTVLAMARRRDVPGPLEAISARGTPWRADLAVAVVVTGLVLVLRPDSAVGLSAFAVLLYYAVANTAALRLAPAERRWPRWTAYLGLAGCLVLAATLPPRAVLAGVAALLAAVGARLLVRAASGRSRRRE